jgi:hypothetical protein
MVCDDEIELIRDNQWMMILEEEEEDTYGSYLKWKRISLELIIFPRYCWNIDLKDDWIRILI